MEKNTKTILIVLGVIVLLSYTGMLNNIFMGAIEETPACREWQTVNGVRTCKTPITCTTNTDCDICIGSVFGNLTKISNELGSGYCGADKKCYVSEYCLGNTVVIKDWIKAHPFAWAKQNPMLFFGGIALVIFGLIAYLPRRRGKVRLF